MNHGYDDMEIDDLDIMLALHTIKQVCVRNVCTECPFSNNSGSICCIIQNGYPDKWEIKEHEIWRAFK